MKRGFTLAEIMIASVIILVVLTALAVALMSFARGSRAIELQDGALTLARLELAEMERSMLLPAQGITSRADSIWGNHYTVETSVISGGDNAIEVTVAVASGDTLSIDLTRRFYDNESQ
ncbi:MAG TPA: type II secretion system protein [Candidatus Sabulitectum sp.]|nr:type II secretion system protein [Candidatus Sabulitectum sp.]HPR22329.1 type II secretion system protein [Candidatus Sabulitectum sp.]